MRVKAACAVNACYDRHGSALSFQGVLPERMASLLDFQERHKAASLSFDLKGPCCRFILTVALTIYLCLLTHQS